MGIPRDLDPEFVRHMIAQTMSSCIFTIDAGTVNALV